MVRSFWNEKNVEEVTKHYFDMIDNTKNNANRLQRIKSFDSFELSEMINDFENELGIEVTNFNKYNQKIAPE